MAFQEKGIKPEDGILKFIQANPELFSDRSTLPDIVAKKVKKKWNPKWRNELKLKKVGQPINATDVKTGDSGHYYHIKVENLHQRNMARNCLGYIEKIEKIDALGKKGEIELPVIELKWANVTHLMVRIPHGKRFRKLDAFHVVYDPQSKRIEKVKLGINENYVDCSPIGDKFELDFPGEYKIIYVVYSDNFLQARATFKLRIGEKLD